MKPLRYVAYPRNLPENYGSIEKLLALGDGYFGIGATSQLARLGYVIVLVFALPIYAFLGWIFLVVVPIAPILIFLFAYPYCLRIIYARNWPRGYAIAASILLGLIPWVGIFVVRMIALVEMRKYGLRSTPFLTQKAFQEFVAQRIERDNQMTTLPTIPLDVPEIG